MGAAVWVGVCSHTRALCGLQQESACVGQVAQSEILVGVDVSAEAAQ